MPKLKCPENQRKLRENPKITINHSGHSEAQRTQRRDRREIKIENVTTLKAVIAVVKKKLCAFAS